MLVILFLGIVTIIIIIIKLDLKKRKILKNKKVKFNLSKNEIMLIPPRSEKHEIIPSKEKSSLIKDKVNFGNYMYGEKIIKNSDFFNSKHEQVNSIQNEFNNNLENKKDDILEDMFKNQKGYWESQVIDDYVYREYSNKQVDNFNNFRKNDHLGENISHVYDQLTNVHEKNGTFFGETNILNDDKTVMHNINDRLYGYDYGCNITQ